MPDLITAFIHYGWWPGPWILVMPLIWISVVFLAIWLARRFGWGHRRGGYGGGPSALQILDRRFAEGDLSAEEYRERRNTLSNVV